MSDTQSLVTGDSSTLPADVAALLDPSMPLPANVQFFERRFDLREITRRLVVGVGLLVASAIIIPLGVYMLIPTGPVTVASGAEFTPLFFGIVLAFAGWLLISSIRSCNRLRNQQLAGQCTRRGVFITGATIVVADVDETTVITRQSVISATRRDLNFRFNDKEKSTSLTIPLLDATPEQLAAAVAHFCSRTPPPLP